MEVPRPTMESAPACNRSRRHGKVRLIVLHDTCGIYPGDLHWLTCRESKVSSDFYVRNDGEIWQLNPDLTGMKCWHAGVSSYEGYSNLNEYSIGVEMEHAEAGGAWPDRQVKSASHLVAWLVQQFRLDLDTHPIVGHAAVALPRGRKSDPRGFPWTDFGQEVRRLLGEQTTSATLLWGQTGKPIDVELHSVDGTMLANADELVACTGLSLLPHENGDGTVSVRRFFEAHGYRVEWNGNQSKVEVFPQE